MTSTTASSEIDPRVAVLPPGVAGEDPGDPAFLALLLGLVDGTLAATLPPEAPMPAGITEAHVPDEGGSSGAPSPSSAPGLAAPPSRPTRSLSAGLASRPPVTLVSSSTRDLASAASVGLVSTPAALPPPPPATLATSPPLAPASRPSVALASPPDEPITIEARPSADHDPVASAPGPVRRARTGGAQTRPRDHAGASVEAPEDRGVDRTPSVVMALPAAAASGTSVVPAGDPAVVELAPAEARADEAGSPPARSAPVEGALARELAPRLFLQDVRATSVAGAPSASTRAVEPAPSPDPVPVVRHGVDATKTESPALPSRVAPDAAPVTSTGAPWTAARAVPEVVPSIDPLAGQLEEPGQRRDIDDLGRPEPAAERRPTAAERPRATSGDTPGAERAPTAAPPSVGAAPPSAAGDEAPSPRAPSPARFVVEQVVSGVARLELGEGRQAVYLRLDPPELGAVRIEAVLERGEITLTIRPEREAARELLVEGLPELREALADRSVAAGHLRVELDVDGRGWSAPDRWDGWRSRRDPDEVPRRPAPVARAGPGRPRTTRVDLFV